MTAENGEINGPDILPAGKVQSDSALDKIRAELFSMNCFFLTLVEKQVSGGKREALSEDQRPREAKPEADKPESDSCKSAKFEAGVSKTTSGIWQETSYGDKQITLPDGSTIRRWSTDTITADLVDKIAVIVRLNGSTTIDGLNGVSIDVLPQQIAILGFPDERSVTFAPDGSRFTRFQDGTTCLQHANGSTLTCFERPIKVAITESPDGRRVADLPDGRRVDLKNRQSGIKDAAPNTVASESEPATLLNKLSEVSERLRTELILITASAQVPAKLDFISLLDSLRQALPAELTTPMLLADDRNRLNEVVRTAADGTLLRLPHGIEIRRVDEPEPPGVPGDQASQLQSSAVRDQRQPAPRTLDVLSKDYKEDKVEQAPLGEYSPVGPAAMFGAPQPVLAGGTGDAADLVSADKASAEGAAEREESGARSGAGIVRSLDQAEAARRRFVREREQGLEEKGLPSSWAEVCSRSKSGSKDGDSFNSATESAAKRVFGDDLTMALDAGPSRYLAYCLKQYITGNEQERKKAIESLEKEVLEGDSYLAGKALENLKKIYLVEAVRRLETAVTEEDQRRAVKDLAALEAGDSKSEGAGKLLDELSRRSASGGGAAEVKRKEAMVASARLEAKQENLGALLAADQAVLQMVFAPPEGRAAALSGLDEIGRSDLRRYGRADVVDLYKQAALTDATARLKDTDDPKVAARVLTALAEMAAAGNSAAATFLREKLEPEWTTGIQQRLTDKSNPEGAKHALQELKDKLSSTGEPTITDLRAKTPAEILSTFGDKEAVEAARDEIRQFAAENLKQADKALADFLDRAKTEEERAAALKSLQELSQARSRIMHSDALTDIVQAIAAADISGRIHRSAAEAAQAIENNAGEMQEKAAQTARFLSELRQQAVARDGKGGNRYALAYIERVGGFGKLEELIKAIQSSADEIRAKALSSVRETLPLPDSDLDKLRAGRIVRELHMGSTPQEFAVAGELLAAEKAAGNKRAEQWITWVEIHQAVATVIQSQTAGDAGEVKKAQEAVAKALTGPESDAVLGTAFDAIRARVPGSEALSDLIIKGAGKISEEQFAQLKGLARSGEQASLRILAGMAGGAGDDDARAASAREVLKDAGNVPALRQEVISELLHAYQANGDKYLLLSTLGAVAATFRKESDVPPAVRQALHKGLASDSTDERMSAARGMEAIAHLWGPSDVKAIAGNLSEPVIQSLWTAGGSITANLRRQLLSEIQWNILQGSDPARPEQRQLAIQAFTVFAKDVTEQQVDLLRLHGQSYHLDQVAKGKDSRGVPYADVLKGEAGIALLAVLGRTEGKVKEAALVAFEKDKWPSIDEGLRTELLKMMKGQPFNLELLEKAQKLVYGLGIEKPAAAILKEWQIPARNDAELFEKADQIKRHYSDPPFKPGGDELLRRIATNIELVNSLTPELRKELFGLEGRMSPQQVAGQMLNHLLEQSTNQFLLGELRKTLETKLSAAAGPIEDLKGKLSSLQQERVDALKELERVTKGKIGLGDRAQFWGQMLGVSAVVQAVPGVRVENPYSKFDETQSNLVARIRNLDWRISALQNLKADATPRHEALLLASQVARYTDLKNSGNRQEADKLAVSELWAKHGELLAKFAPTVHRDLTGDDGTQVGRTAQRRLFDAGLSQVERLPRYKSDTDSNRTESFCSALSTLRGLRATNPKTGQSFFDAEVLRAQALQAVAAEPGMRKLSTSAEQLSNDMQLLQTMFASAQGGLKYEFFVSEAKKSASRLKDSVEKLTGELSQQDLDKMYMRIADIRRAARECTDPEAKNELRRMAESMEGMRDLLDPNSSKHKQFMHMLESVNSPNFRADTLENWIKQHGPELAATLTAAALTVAACATFGVASPLAVIAWCSVSGVAASQVTKEVLYRVNESGYTGWGTAGERSAIGGWVEKYGDFTNREHLGEFVKILGGHGAQVVFDTALGLATLGTCKAFYSSINLIALAKKQGLRAAAGSVWAGMSREAMKDALNGFVTAEAPTMARLAFDARRAAAIAEGRTGVSTAARDYLKEFLRLSGREVLTNAGFTAAQMCLEGAVEEFAPERAKKILHDSQEAVQFGLSTVLAIGQGFLLSCKPGAGGRVRFLPANAAGERAFIEHFRKDGYHVAAGKLPGTWEVTHFNATPGTRPFVLERGIADVPEHVFPNGTNRPSASDTTPSLPVETRVEGDGHIWQQNEHGAKTLGDVSEFNKAFMEGRFAEARQLIQNKLDSLPAHRTELRPLEVNAESLKTPQQLKDYLQQMRDLSKMRRDGAAGAEQKLVTELPQPVVELEKGVKIDLCNPGEPLRTIGGELLSEAQKSKLNEFCSAGPGARILAEQALNSVEEYMHHRNAQSGEGIISPSYAKVCRDMIAVGADTNGDLRKVFSNNPAGRSAATFEQEAILMLHDSDPVKWNAEMLRRHFGGQYQEVREPVLKWIEAQESARLAGAEPVVKPIVQEPAFKLEGRVAVEERKLELGRDNEEIALVVPTVNAAVYRDLEVQIGRLQQQGVTPERVIALRAALTEHLTPKVIATKLEFVREVKAAADQLVAQNLSPDRLAIALDLLQTKLKHEHVTIYFGRIDNQVSVQALKLYRDMIAQSPKEARVPVDVPDGVRFQHNARRPIDQALAAPVSVGDVQEHWAFVPSSPNSPADNIGMDGMFVNLRSGVMVPVDLGLDALKKADRAWYLNLGDQLQSNLKSGRSLSQNEIQTVGRKIGEFLETSRQQKTYLKADDFSEPIISKRDVSSEPGKLTFPLFETTGAMKRLDLSMLETLRFQIKERLKSGAGGQERALNILFDGVERAHRFKISEQQIQHNFASRCKLALETMLTNPLAPTLEAGVKPNQRVVVDISKERFGSKDVPISKLILDGSEKFTFRGRDNKSGEDKVIDGGKFSEQLEESGKALVEAGKSKLEVDELCNKIRSDERYRSEFLSRVIAPERAAQDAASFQDARGKVDISKARVEGWNEWAGLIETGTDGRPGLAQLVEIGKYFVGDLMGSQNDPQFQKRMDKVRIETAGRQASAICTVVKQNDGSTAVRLRDGVSQEVAEREVLKALLEIGLKGDENRKLTAGETKIVSDFGQVFGSIKPSPPVEAAASSKPAEASPESGSRIPTASAETRSLSLGRSDGRSADKATVWTKKASAPTPGPEPEFARFTRPPVQHPTAAEKVSVAGNRYEICGRDVVLRPDDSIAISAVDLGIVGGQGTFTLMNDGGRTYILPGKSIELYINGKRVEAFVDTALKTGDEVRVGGKDGALLSWENVPARNTEASLRDPKSELPNTSRIDPSKLSPEVRSRFAAEGLISPLSTAECSAGFTKRGVEMAVRWDDAKLLDISRRADEAKVRAELAHKQYIERVQKKVTGGEMLSMSEVRATLEKDPVTNKEKLAVLQEAMDAGKDCLSATKAFKEVIESRRQDLESLVNELARAKGMPETKLTMLTDSEPNGLYANGEIGVRQSDLTDKAKLPDLLNTAFHESIHNADEKLVVSGLADERNIGTFATEYQKLELIKIFHERGGPELSIERIGQILQARNGKPLKPGEAHRAEILAQDFYLWHSTVGKPSEQLRARLLATGAEVRSLRACNSLAEFNRFFEDFAAKVSKVESCEQFFGLSTPPEAVLKLIEKYQQVQAGKLSSEAFRHEAEPLLDALMVRRVETLVSLNKIVHKIYRHVSIEGATWYGGAEVERLTRRALGQPETPESAEKERARDIVRRQE
jgi:hypothetical protein